MTITGEKKEKAPTQKQQAEEKVSPEEVFPTASQVVKSDETTRDGEVILLMAEPL